VFRDVEMEDPLSTVFDDEKTIQDSEGEGGHGEEVHGRNGLAVMAQESRPELGGVVGRGQAPEIAEDGAFGDVEAEVAARTEEAAEAGEEADEKWNHGPGFIAEGSVPAPALVA